MNLIVPIFYPQRLKSNSDDKHKKKKKIKKHT